MSEIMRQRRSLTGVGVYTRFLGFRPLLRVQVLSYATRDLRNFERVCQPIVIWSALFGGHHLRDPA